MNYFNKMVLLPIDEFNKYRNLLYSSQVSPQVNPLQNELNQIKETYGSTMPDDLRAKLEAEVVQKYSEKIPDKVASHVQVDPSKIEWIQSAINNFAKTNQARAKRIYDLLLNRAKNRWNENGELLTVDGEVIRGSNIIDLINFVTSTNYKKNQQVPHAFREFKSLINEANVPLHMLSKNGIEYIYEEEDKQSNSDEEKFERQYDELLHEKLKITPRHKGKRHFQWDKHE